MIPFTFNQMLTQCWLLSVSLCFRTDTSIQSRAISFLAGIERETTNKVRGIFSSVAAADAIGDKRIECLNEAEACSCCQIARGYSKKNYQVLLSGIDIKEEEFIIEKEGVETAAGSESRKRDAQHRTSSSSATATATATASSSYSASASASATATATAVSDVPCPCCMTKKRSKRSAAAATGNSLATASAAASSSTYATSVGTTAGRTLRKTKFTATVSTLYNLSLPPYQMLLY
jgi:hypothetical protein